MITSTNNSRIKHIVQLQKKRKFRDEEGVFVVEGIRMFQEVPSAQVLDVFATESFYNTHREIFKKLECEQDTHILVDDSSGRGGFKNRIELVTDEVFAKISETKTPQGVLCVVERNSYDIEQILNIENKLLLVLENLQDPGNVGTIIRTGEAAGVTGVILTRACADLYQPKTIRSTMGSIFRMPCVFVEDLADTMKELEARNVTTYGTHLQGAQWYNEVTYDSDAAILVGNEGKGLTDAITDLVDVKIKIPMVGQVESLNAGIAASIVMYEAFGQRR